MATNQRERAKKQIEARDKRPFAVARYIRIASGKVEIVLDLIRGKKFDEAVRILTFTNKSASPVILKVLNSAGANAENNKNMPKDSLYVAECYAMQGPTMKRMMPRAKGRGDRILKRTCHIKVILDEKIDTTPVAKPKPKKDAPKKAAAPAKKPTAPKPAAKPKVEKKVEVKDGTES